GPHLLRLNERFHVDGNEISDDELARLMTETRRLSENFGKAHPELGALTWFEFLTVVAFFWFTEKAIDVAVIEVGLGGRFDATNMIKNVVASVITNIDLDHTQILGHTVAEIAFEKAGIIKRGIPLITGCSGDALKVIVDRALTVGAGFPVLRCGKDGEVTTIEPDGRLSARREFEPDQAKANSESKELCRNAYDLFRANRKELSLLGEYQEANALLGLTALLASGMLAKRNADQISQIVRDGFRNVYWAGRLQYIPSRRLVLDGAHNNAGAIALRQSLDKLFPGRQFCFLLSCFENKNVREIIDSLYREGDRILVSEASTRRATFDKAELARIAESLGAQPMVFDSIMQSFEFAQNQGYPDEIIVATGSFATVREVALAMGWQSVEDGKAECAKITGSTLRR
ncbi:MAG TPA: hypothetical protein V6C72_03090, partial [Chroococcales cyanobacterium]